MGKGLPIGWEEFQLIELLEVLENGSRPKGGVQGILEGIPSLGGEHLDYNGGFKFHKLKYVPEEFADQMKRGLIKTGDILIVKDGATTGKTSFVDENFPYKRAFVNEHVFICRPFNKLSSKLISYFLRGKEGQSRILENFTGSAQGGINQKFASNTLIPIPPLAEQKHIVTKLDALFGHLDTLKSKLDRIPVLLKNFRQHVLTQAVTGKLTEEWREGKGLGDWTNLKMADLITNIEAGKNFTAPEIPVTKGKVGLVKISAVTWDEFDPRETKTVEDERMINPRYFIKKDDFLISRANTLELVGASVIVKEINHDIMISDKVWRVEFKNSTTKLFINRFIKSPIGRKEIESRATGNQLSMRNLSQKNFKDIDIALPPIEEQREIVKRVEELFTIAYRIESQYQSLKEKIDELPQAILNKTFKGELMPQDPNDEPASVLLERIKEVKEKSKRKSSKLQVQGSRHGTSSTNVTLTEKSRRKIKKNLLSGSIKGSSTATPTLSSKLIIKSLMDLIEIIKKEFGEASFSYSELNKKVNPTSKKEYIELKNRFFELLRNDKMNKKAIRLEVQSTPKIDELQYKLKET